MRSRMPLVCLVAASQALYAANGMDAWRQGNFMEAARELSAQSAGDVLADYYQGMMFLYGYGQLRNEVQAIRYLTLAANKGYLPAVQMLAHYTLTQKNSPEQAFPWFKKAAEAGDVSAQMYCASALLFGNGVRVNEDAARRYYIDAARAGNPRAQYVLARYFLDSRSDSNRKLGLIWLNKAVDAGFANAQYYLGTLYESGKAVPKDAVKAREYYVLAEKQNYVPALVGLGNLDLHDGKWAEAKAFFTRAADKGNIGAQFSMAQYYLDSKNPEYNPETGFLWTLKAAENGSGKARLALAGMYRDGIGVAKNPSLAAQWTTRAKEPVNASRKTASVRAARWLSNDTADTFVNYLPGGIFSAWTNRSALVQNIYNPSPERKRLTRAMLFKPDFSLVKPDTISISDYFDILGPMLAEREDKTRVFPTYPIDTAVDEVSRQQSLVLMHEAKDDALPETDDEGVPSRFAHQPDPLETMQDKIGNLTPSSAQKSAWQTVLNELYGRAILGESSAQFQIGQLYHFGIGVAKNRQQAIIYYQLAASQQELRAAYNLGLLYLQDPVTPSDYKTGMDWLLDAAFKGNDHAQYVLALIGEEGFRNGSGDLVIPVDREMSMAMYHLASSNHYGPAEYRLAEDLVKDQNSSLNAQARAARAALVRQLYASAAKQGVAEAVLPLAFYDAMDTDPKKQQSAFKTAEQEAQNGDPQAAVLLGIMYDRGIATPPNISEAINWYQQAKSNPVSQFILGTRYCAGNGVSADRTECENLLQAAANSGFSWAALNLAIMRYQDGKDFLQPLNDALRMGNSTAGLLLADYWLAQGGNSADIASALSIYQRFAEKGDKNAQMKLGFLQEAGLVGSSNRIEAEKWYTLSASQGDPVAQYLLGQFWQMGGITGIPDYEKAKYWYQQAAARLPMAQVALGFVHDVVDANYAAASEAYGKAAAANDPLGQFDLGVMLEMGKGQPVDYANAKLQYQTAAGNGNSEAMTRLGDMAFRGLGGDRNEAEALHWYREAANRGNSDAMYALGLFAETGVALKLDYAKAEAFYTRAAGKGNQKAMLALARMYQYGIGVPKHMEHAVRYYRELAGLQNANAQYQLARLSLEGVPTGLLPADARKYLEAARLGGNEQAALLLRRMEARAQKQISVLEPIRKSVSGAFRREPAERMYLEAVNAWNRGNEVLSRAMLDTLRLRFPQYTPGQRAWEQINRRANDSEKTV